MKIIWEDRGRRDGTAHPNPAFLLSSNGMVQLNACAPPTASEMTVPLRKPFLGGWLISYSPTCSRRTLFFFFCGHIHTRESSVFQERSRSGCPCSWRWKHLENGLHAFGVEVSNRCASLEGIFPTFFSGSVTTTSYKKSRRERHVGKTR